MDEHPVDQGDVRSSDGLPVSVHGLTPPADPEATESARRWQTWLLLLGSWLVTRAWLVAIGTWNLPVYPDGPLAFDDLLVYRRWLPSLTAGQIPTDDMWQYPPAAALFFLAGAVGHSPIAAFIVAILLVDLLLLIVLAHHDRRSGWFWVAAGLAIGPVLVSRFDVVPTLFAVLAVLTAARPMASGAWAAVGAAVKVWPLFVLFVVARRGAVKAAGSFVVVLLAIVGLTLVVFDGVGVFLGGQGSRGLQAEAVFALPFVVSHAIGGDVEYAYRYGSMEVASDGAGTAALLATVVLALLLGWSLWCWARGWFEHRLAADVAFTVVLFTVIGSRVNSPQYAIWLLGLGALCFAHGASQVRVPVLMIMAAAVLTQILYPWGYGSLLGGVPSMAVIHAIRIILEVAAAAWAGWVVCRPPPRRV